MSQSKRRYIDQAFLVALSEGVESSHKFLCWAIAEIGSKRWRNMTRLLLKQGLVTHAPEGRWIITALGLRAIGRSGHEPK